LPNPTENRAERRVAKAHRRLRFSSHRPLPPPQAIDDDDQTSEISVTLCISSW
jgi:hypothetical protein